MDTKEKSRRSVEEIDRLKALWTESGKNKTQFCLEQGLNYMTFISWFNQKDKSASNKFVALKVKDDVQKIDAGVFVEVFLEKGRRVVFHQAVGAEILRAILR